MPLFFSCQMELTTLLAALKVALSIVCVKHPNSIVKSTRRRAFKEINFQKSLFYV